MRACAIIIAASLIIAGCGDPPHEDPKVKGKEYNEHGHPLIRDNGRFAIEAQTRFRAGFNDNIRDILIITDRKSGHRYLAITGCGITELRQETRRSGKTSTTVTLEE